ncbi:cytochrome d ubiquinol oxidase subunit II [Gallaecimonas pentaromativorans]|uniref:Cytochrome bd-I ubiquinol oxidase subunit 2 apoprotein n=1 Tax=Gallaecimonas pentaromativorans TaxID=584787 RepID=A0A3N1PYM3_9GAMM|nr:cytochrome d ubiquinol oxidase subunit II [Gallaecimonas pentaromativorans]ROQ29666.1 cytochrome bd-I ubiquinol oxidase subunit 2 apoprotein [Gallaecimonas pentaromativorans]
MGIDLPVIWAVIIALGVMLYIVMDGFDLGIGILFPLIKDRQERDLMVNTVAPVWDGNETWLVLGGAGLMAAFPLAYSVILSALYLPLLAMLIGLIWRGVAFEFRFKSDESHRPFWDKAFFSGSLLATFSQGVVLGSFVQGIKVVDNAYAGGIFDWLSPFSLFCGLGLVVTYALLGSTWLVLKTEGRLYAQVCQLSRQLVALLLVFMLAVSLWTPLQSPAVFARWFSLPNLYFFLPVPVLTLLACWALVRSVSGKPHMAPFVLTLVLVFLGYSGLIISIWPHVIPPGITLEQASSPPQSQGFALVGALLILPVILGYTAWSYYVFRGKVRLGDGYHH